MDTRGISNTPFKALVYILVVMGFFSLVSASGGTDRPTKVGSVNKQSQIVEVDPREIMKDLIQTHPHPEVRQRLNELILQGEIGLSFQQLQSAPNTVANVAYSQSVRNGKMMLALNYVAEALLDPRDSKIHKQLIIYHEWIHIKQQRAGRAPGWMAGLDEPLPSSEEIKRIRMATEMEAYTAECQLAVDLGATKEFDFCQVYAVRGSPGLRKAIFGS